MQVNIKKIFLDNEYIVYLCPLPRLEVQWSFKRHKITKYQQLKENQPKAKNERAFAIAFITNKKTNRNYSSEMQLRQPLQSFYFLSRQFLRFAVLFAICFNILLSFRSIFRCSSVVSNCIFKDQLYFIVFYLHLHH